MSKVPSKHTKEGTCKDALYTIHRNPGHLTINQLESLVISIFQAHNTLNAYWYNISQDGDENRTKYELTSFNIPCSCKHCRLSDGVCPFLSFRDKRVHDITLKKKIMNRTDQELANMDISKLTIPDLKVQLNARSMSTTHQKKLDLVQRLSEYLIQRTATRN